MSDISKSISNIRKIDELGDKDTMIHRIDSSIKIIVTIIYVIRVLSMKKFIISDITCIVFYPLILFIFGKVPVTFIFKKVLFVLPVILGLSLINLIIDFAIRNGNITRDDLVNTEPFSDIEIPELFEHELAPILQLVAMFTNPLKVVA